MPSIVFRLGSLPQLPFHAPRIPGLTARASKLLTAGAAVVISITMITFTVFSILTTNKDFKKAHGIVTPTEQLQQSNDTQKSSAALPGGGTAVGVGGTTGTNSPVVTLTAQPASVVAGAKSHLKWSVTNSPTSCVASDDWSGDKQSTGEADTDALVKVQTYIFTLTCKTSTGTGFATVSVGAVAQGGSGDVATRPAVRLAANPTAVYVGQDTMLSWEVSNSPTSCTASGDWSGSKQATGTFGTGALGAVKTYTYTLTCANSAGSGYATVTVQAVELPPDIPIVSLIISPVGSVRPGSSITLTWTTTNSPTSCTASDSWSGAKSTGGGTQQIGPLSAIQSYTYTLTCYNSSGSSFDGVTVDVLPAPPDVSLTASPASIYVGASSTLTWSATNSPTSCTASASPASAAWTGAQQASGSAGTGAISSAGTYYYSLSCTNAGGTGNARNVALTVTVPPAPVVSLSVSPIAVTAGNSANLTWSSTNTPTSCTGSSAPANAGWNGGRVTSGTMSTGVLSSAGTYSYTLSCTNAGGTGQSTTSLTVSSGGAVSAPVVTISVSPTSIGTGGSATVSWSATNSPTSCVASGTSGAWVASPGASGSTSTGVKNTAGTFTYTMTCSNSAGSDVKSANLTVIATPVVNISVSPTTITTGSNTTVTWSATNSPSSCTATGNAYWSGSKSAAGGSQQVGPITTAGPYTFSMTCTNTGGTSAVASASLTVANAVYCGGSTPCYGPNDLAAHNTVGNCWGYNISPVYDITSFNNGYHKNGKPGTNLLPGASSPLCGNVSIASYLAGTSLSGVGSHNHQTSTKNNSNATLSGYRTGYYDAAKP